MTTMNPPSSGLWSGCWIRAGETSRHPMRLYLTFQDGRVQGSGDDEVGRFTMEGECASSDNYCSMTKTYVGSHGVEYRATWTGAGYAGEWRIPDGGSGTFALWPGEFEAAPPELEERMPKSSGRSRQKLSTRAIIIIMLLIMMGLTIVEILIIVVRGNAGSGE
jgi:hypothetical protein